MCVWVCVCVCVVCVLCVLLLLCWCGVWCVVCCWCCCSCLCVVCVAARAAARVCVGVSYTHLRAHETPDHLACGPLLENIYPLLLSTPLSLLSPRKLLHSLRSHTLKFVCYFTMAATISTSSPYPVVRVIDEEEYGTCCCIDGTVMSGFSLQALPPVLPNQSMHQRSQSDQSNNSSKSAKRSSLFQAKRRRSAVQRARSEGALIDTSDTQTISTEAEDKKFVESFVLTRQVSDACTL